MELNGDIIIVWIALILGFSDFVLRILSDGTLSFANIMVSVIMLVVYYVVLWILLHGYRLLNKEIPGTPKLN